jgi:hypothetical protein
MNKKERFEKFCKLPKEIQEGLLNSSKSELNGFLKLSHKERESLSKLPFGSRKYLSEMLNLNDKVDNFDDFENELYDLLRDFGSTLARKKVMSLSEIVAKDFEKMNKKKD